MGNVSGLATVPTAAGKLDVYYHLDGNRAVIDSVELETCTTDIKAIISSDVMDAIHNVIWGIK